MLVVVDDSPELDAEIFNMEEYEGADWVLISDEVPVDEHRRDELLEAFQVARAGRRSSDDEDDDEVDELEPDDRRGVGLERPASRDYFELPFSSAGALLHLGDVLAGGLDALV